MDYKNEEMEPLEAREDGTFDLGDLPPCTSNGNAQPISEAPIQTTAEGPPQTKAPGKPEDKQEDSVSTNDESRTAPSASEPSSVPSMSRGDTGDNRKRTDEDDLREGDGEPSEEFIDAVEALGLTPELPPLIVGGNGETECSVETSTASGETRGSRQPSGQPRGWSEAQPVKPCDLDPLGAGSNGSTKRTSFIAEGLSSVRLPMAYSRITRVPESLSRSEGYEHSDSEGETEFHDAIDTAAGLVKDANKAREMKEAGNAHYKNGDYEDAVDYYTMALHYCPDGEEHNKDKAIYLGNRAQAHLRLQEFDDVVVDCTAALEVDPSYMKALLRRAQANEQLEKYDLALEDTKTLVEIDPNLRSAKENMARLEKLQADKTEKMKEEAIGKLKELGNSVLGNFGLSLDNFKMVQDPNSGSYSINFER